MTRECDQADSEDDGGNGEAEAAEARQARKALIAELTGPVFGLPFFASVLKDRLEQHCSGAGPEVPQLFLHLVSGGVLDVCHIVELSPKWVAAAAFREEERSCALMDLEFVPYELILRVTLSTRPADEHQLGFDMKRSVPAMQAAQQRQEGEGPPT